LSSATDVDGLSSATYVADLSSATIVADLSIADLSATDIADLRTVAGVAAVKAVQF